MSETGRSGINRAFSWLKRTLEITEETVAPDQLSPVVVPSMDVFGWERFDQLTFQTITSGVGGTNVQFPSVAAGTVRVYFYASVRINVAGPFNIWVGVRQPSGGTVALTPVDAAVSGQKVAPLQRPVVLPENFQLEGRSEAAILAGSIILEAFFIDLPAGEYIPPS